MPDRFSSPNLPGDRTVLVTGASAGIGEAFARVFAAHGWHLVITARRADRLRALKGELESNYQVMVRTVTADLADPASPTRIADELSAAGVHVDALVNNAGYGVPGSYVANPWQRHQDFMQVLVHAVVEMTYRLLPAMIDRGYGRIINVASLAGLVPAPAGHTLYGAAKAFLIKFSEALSNEVRHHNVHVTAVCPGFTRSEFHDVTGTRAKMNMPSWMWMDAATVARQGFAAAMAGEFLYINGRINRTIAALVRHLPQRLVYSIGRRAGRRYRKA
jgi:hypothetical protein